MKLTNAYQAILAKLGGNQTVNIPAPRNKYEKLLNDIPVNGGSGGGSTEPVIADTQTVVGDDNGYYALTPTNSYGDPSSYVGKTVQMEITMDEFSVLGSGVIGNGDFGPYTIVGDASTDLGQLNLENNRLLFMAYDLTPGQELTIKVSIAEESSGSGAGGLVVHDNNGTLDKTWQEIYDAMASGRSVVIDYGNSVCLASAAYIIGNTYYYVITPAPDSANYIANSSDNYPEYSEEDPIS